MWPGEQPPGGAQNPQNNPYQQPGYQQPNPYQQPGYQQYPQANPYGQQPQWGAPAPVGTPQPGQPPQGGGNRTKVIAIVAASAVVVAAGVTGFLILGNGGSKDDKADGKGGSTTSHSPTADPSVSASDDNPRGGDGEKPVIAGWKVVINPRFGTAFDVPADWEVESADTSRFMEDHSDKDKLITSVASPALYKSKWCTDDTDHDGKSSNNALATAGTRGENGAKNPADAAVARVPWYVYGGYTQPDKKSITFDKKATPYTTKSGVQGAYAWARSSGTPQKGKCASDGKAISFAFKNSADDIVSFDLYGSKGVSEELDNATIMKILSSVRLHGEPTD